VCQEERARLDSGREEIKWREKGILKNPVKLVDKISSRGQGQRTACYDPGPGSQPTDNEVPGQRRNRQLLELNEVAASHAVSRANWSAKDHRRGHQLDPQRGDNAAGSTPSGGAAGSPTTTSAAVGPPAMAVAAARLPTTTSAAPSFCGQRQGYFFSTRGGVTSYFADGHDAPGKGPEPEPEPPSDANRAERRHASREAAEAAAAARVDTAAAREAFRVAAHPELVAAGRELIPSEWPGCLAAAQSSWTGWSLGEFQPPTFQPDEGKSYRSRYAAPAFVLPPSLPVQKGGGL
jgi:hypothetical protein